MMNDLEKFFKAFARDRKILGEELTIGIYEDIFSYFEGKPVKGFDEVSEMINEDGTLNVGFTEEELCEGIGDKLKRVFSGDKFKSLMPQWLTDVIYPNPGRNAEFMNNMTKTAEALNAAAGTGVGFNTIKKAAQASEKASGFSNWLLRAKNGIKNFFKGDNIKRLLNNGVAWFTNPANAPKILGGAGGLILLTIIIKSLKKRKQLKKYQNLERIYNMGLREAVGDYNYAFDEIVEESKTNKKLYNLMFTDEFLDEEYHCNYMNY